MSFFYRLLWGEPQPIVQQPKEDMDDFVVVDFIQKVTKQDVLELDQKLPPLHSKEPTLYASICCVPDAKKKLELYNRKFRLRSPIDLKALEENGPYKQAFTSKETIQDSTLLRTYIFINSKILGVRGRMIKDEPIQLLNGKIIDCSTQALNDLTRWGPHSHFTLQNDVISLAVPENATALSLSESRVIPLNLVGVLDKIESTLGSNTKFTRFTQYFNQGPFNDMMYAMSWDIEKKWKATLFPNRNMERTFHLISEKSEKDTRTVHILQISLSGFFVAGAFGDHGIIEPREGQNLGHFSGKTLLNLNTGAATVETHVEVYPATWEILNRV